MMSSGQWHKKVPKDFYKNVAYRVKLMKLLKGNRVGQRAFRLFCQQDILFYINTFVWQINPKKQGREVGPFITWDFQDEAIVGQDPHRPGILWCIENKRDLVVLKSREMGASWLFLIVMDWLALFHPEKHFITISKSEEAVIGRNPNSLFWKIDFMHKHLPDWLKGDINRRKTSYEYKNTSSTITGEASTGRAGVGGRAPAMFIDEFPQIKEDYEVLDRTADTTDCRIFNGTHNGIGTAFFELTQRVDLKKLVMHWSQHPDKKKGLYRYDPANSKVAVLDHSYAYDSDFDFIMDGSPVGGPYPGLRSPWYDFECRRRSSDRAVAMDLDINPTGSVSQFFQALLIRELVQEHTLPPRWRGEIEYDLQTGEPAGLVPSEDGHLHLWCLLDLNGRPPHGPYAIGCDNSTGQGATPTCLSIVHMETGQKVGEYRNANIEPTPFAAYGVAVCKWFRSLTGAGAKFVWEIAGPGMIMGRRVLELGYRNIYWREREIKGMLEVSDQPGWASTANTKLLLLSEYREALALRKFLNPSKDSLEECLNFRFDESGNVVHGFERNKKDPAGSHSNHGDQVIADALAWRGCKASHAPASKPEETIIVGSLAWRRQLAHNLRRIQADIWV